jgi:hypothetical protein
MTPEEQRAATEALALEDPAVVEARERDRFAAELAAIVRERCAGEALTTGEVARRYGVSREHAKAAMGKLADAGKVVAVGKDVGAVGVWRVAAVEEPIPDTLSAGEVKP